MGQCCEVAEHCLQAIDYQKESGGEGCRRIGSGTNMD